MTSAQIKDLVKRALWTAGEGFLASFLTLAPGILNAPNLATARALGVSAIVAGLGAAASALKGLVLTYRPSTF